MTAKVLIGHKNTVQVRADEIIKGDILVNVSHEGVIVSDVMDLGDEIVLFMDTGKAFTVPPDEPGRIVKRDRGQ